MNQLITNNNSHHSEGDGDEQHPHRAGDDRNAEDQEASSAQEEPRVIVVPREIIELVESYFSDAHLARNRFLEQRIREQNGALSVDLIASQTKVQQRINGDLDYVRAAADASDKLILSKKQNYISRRTALPHAFDLNKFTPFMVYVEGLSSSCSVDQLREEFSAFGPVDYVDLPRYHGTATTKGFAFVQFKSTESVKWTLDYFQGDQKKIPDQVIRQANEKQIPNYTVISKQTWIERKEAYRNTKRSMQRAHQTTKEENSLTLEVPSTATLALVKSYAEMAGDVRHLVPLDKQTGSTNEKRQYRVVYKNRDSVHYGFHIFQQLPIVVHNTAVKPAMDESTPNQQTNKGLQTAANGPEEDSTEVLPAATNQLTSRKRPRTHIERNKDDPINEAQTVNRRNNRKRQKKQDEKAEESTVNVESTTNHQAQDRKDGRVRKKIAKESSKRTILRSKRNTVNRSEADVANGLVVVGGRRRSARVLAKQEPGGDHQDHPTNGDTKVNGLHEQKSRATKQGKAKERGKRK